MWRFSAAAASPCSSGHGSPAVVSEGFAGPPEVFFSSINSAHNQLINREYIKHQVGEKS